MTNVFDSLGTQPAVLGNEILSNAALSYVLDMTGVSERFFENAYADGELMRAAKQGIFVSGVSLAGRLARSWIPQLNVFGEPGTTLQSPIGG